MWDKIKAWLVDMGEFLYRFTRTVAAKFIKEYGPVAMECVKAAAAHGGTGQEKFEYACACFLSKVPGAALYLVQTCVQVAYAMYKEEIEKIDTDKDGVPDYKDLCPEAGIPEGGCVTVDGCPDSDCDSVADSVDPCPADPNCK
jgi:hypothetical protein